MYRKQLTIKHIIKPAGRKKSFLKEPIQKLQYGRHIASNHIKCTINNMLTHLKFEVLGKVIILCVYEIFH